MTNKNVLAYLSEVQTYKKFISLADKTCNLILIYSDKDIIPATLFETINNAKCNIVLKKMPEFDAKNEMQKNVLIAFLFGQLSAEYSNLAILASFPFKLPGSNVRTRKSPVKSKNNSDVIKKPIKTNKTTIGNKKSPKINGKTDTESISTNNSAVKETGRSRKNKYENMSFEEQFDALRKIIGTAAGFNFETNIKKLVDSVRYSVSEKISIKEANKITFTKDKADILNKSFTDAQWKDIINLIIALKDEI